MRRERKQKEAENMKRVAAVFCHPLYIDSIQRNQKAEEGRKYCHHDMEHLLNVARLAYIFSLERKYQIQKEEIYAAAILHDVGKWQQYLEGTPHEKASAEIAGSILRDAGFSEKERERIVYAILCHRTEQMGKISEEGHEKPNGVCEKLKTQLAEILYDADKLSRACFSCRWREGCNWSEEKKNIQLLW